MSGEIRWPEGLVAFWDFADSGPPFKTRAGVGEFPLGNGSGANVGVVADGPFGQAAVFDGISDYLAIPSTEVGALNLSKAGDQCTVLAWVYRESTAPGFVAGMWQENYFEDDPRRQYALFLTLPENGRDTVCGHISSTGGPTPGYGHARDSSSSVRKIGPGRWRFVALTYDGAQIVSYLDGIADSRPSFTDELGITYAKNPYAFTAGLNRTSISDFTVGANRCEVTGGEGDTVMAFRFGGRLGGLAVFQRALSQRKLMGIHLSALADEPAIVFDFYRTGVYGADAATAFGWKSARGPAATATGDHVASANFVGTTVLANDFLFRSAIELPANQAEEGIGYFDDLAGLRASQLETLTFRLNNALAVDDVRLCVRIDDVWYATAETFSVTGDGRTAFDWSDAETKTFAFSRAAGVWATLRFDPGVRLALGDVIASDIPDGDLTGIGFYNGGLVSSSSVVRIADVKLFA